MEVVYNGYTLPKVIEVMTLNRSYSQGSFRCKFLIEKSSASSLVTECQEAETKLSAPLKTFTTDFGGSDEQSFSHSANTYLNPQPRITVVDDEYQTETTRAYMFELDFGLPADLAGFDFRRTSVMGITFDETEAKTVEFYLEYTASDSPLAGSLANFNANGIPFTTSKLSSLFSGVNFERLSLNSSTDDQDKVTTGRIVYREILERQSLSTFNDTSIKSMSINYSLSVPKSVNVTQSLNLESDIMTTLTMDFATSIDKTVVTDAADLEDVYRNKIKPLLLSRCENILKLNTQLVGSFSAMFLEDESHSINPYSYNIQGTIRCSLPKGTNSILSIVETLTTVTDSGINYAKLFDGTNNTYSIWGYGGQVKLIRNVVIRQLGEKTLNQLPVLDGTFVLLNTEMSTASNKVGIDVDNTGRELLVHDISVRETYLLIDDRPPTLGADEAPQEPPSARGGQGGDAAPNRNSVNPQKTFKGSITREVEETRVPVRGTIPGGGAGGLL